MLRTPFDSNMLAKSKWPRWKRLKSLVAKRRMASADPSANMLLQPIGALQRPFDGWRFSMAEILSNWFTESDFYDVGIVWEEMCETQKGFILVLLCFLIPIRKKFLCAKQGNNREVGFLVVMHHQSAEWMSQKTMTLCNNMHSQKCCRVRHFYACKVLVASPNYSIVLFFFLYLCS